MNTLATGPSRTSPRAVTTPAYRPPTTSGLRETGLAALVALGISAPLLGIGGQMAYRVWAGQRDARLAEAAMVGAHQRIVGAKPLPFVEVEAASHGREVFLGVCAACHGAEATGISGLGRNLVNSDFVAAQTDERLVSFIEAGRPEARPMPMPPKGGRPDLTASDLSAVVVYLRGVQDPRRMPVLPVRQAQAAPSQAEKEEALKVAGGNAELAEYIASGKRIYEGTCIACHGKGGTGIQGNGKRLAQNEFIASLDDDHLLAFVKQGRNPTDPKNTTGIQMPPKGGNPALSDDDLLDVISYLRTLQPAPARGG